MTDTLRRVVSAIGFCSLHWLAYGVGIYSRGGSTELFRHFIYEPWLLKALFLLDLPAIFLGDMLVTSFVHSISEVVGTPLYVFLMSMQWLIIGYVFGGMIATRLAAK